MANDNIAEHLRRRAETSPQQMALCVPQCVNGKWQPRVSVTYAELETQVERATQGLQRLGVCAGVRTVLMVPPSPEFFVLTFALFRSGAIPIFVDPGMGLAHLKTCLHAAAPEAFIGIPKAQLARILLRWAPRTLRRFVTVGGPRWLACGSSYGALLASQGTTSPALPTPSGDEPCAILFTSGSTGTPKGAVYSHRIFQAQITALRDLFGITPGEVDLCTFPLFALYAPALGMSAIIPQMDFTRPGKVNTEHILGPIRDFAVENMFGSPALLRRVGLAAQAQGVKLPSLRRVLTAGAPVAVDNLERFQKLLSPGVEVFTPYGATESLPVACIGSREVLGETAEHTRAGAGVCVGRPAPHMKIVVARLTDEPIESWSPDWQVPVGEIGEFVVRGAVVTQAYDGRPEANRLAKIHDPTTGETLHRMGDVGYQDIEGRFWFCGRKSHRVVLAKHTLYSEPVERIFNQHPEVFRTALVGIARGGVVEPVVCVERDRDVRPQSPWPQLQRELLEIGARYPATQQVLTLLRHPAFPVDIRHNSKIFRERLAEWAAQRLGGTPALGPQRK